MVTGTASNNAIMIVTDGAPHGFKEVFETYNWIKHGSRMDKWV